MGKCDICKRLIIKEEPTFSTPQIGLMCSTCAIKNGFTEEYVNKQIIYSEQLIAERRLIAEKR